MKLVSNASLIASVCLLSSAATAQTTTPSGALEEIIVTGIRGSLQRSADIKRENISIVDAISSEDIGEFPDANIADSLQRITGVQISRDRGGEGRFVSIRGLSSQFNMTTLNGRVLATDNAGRDFSFDVVPSEAVQTVAVYKSPMASLTEGSIGGLIQLQLLDPLSQPGFHISSSAGGFYDDVTEEATPRASVVISNTFRDETIGAFLGATYYKRDWRADTYESLVRSGNGETVDANGNGELEPDSYSCCDFRDGYTAIGRAAFPGIPSYQVKFGERERLGAVAGLRFEPTDRLSTTLDVFYSDFETPEQSYSYNINFYTNNGWGRFTNGTLVPWAGGGNNNLMLTSFDIDNIPIEIGNDTNDRNVETYMVGWNTNLRMTDKLSATLDLAFSEADRPNDATNDVYTVAGINGGTFHWSANGPVPRVSCTLADGRSCFNITNDEIGLHFMEQQGEAVNDQATSARLDFDYDIDSGIFSKVEAGLFYSDREKDKVLWRNDDGCAYCGFGDTLGELGVTAVVPFPEGGYRLGTLGDANRWPALDPYKLFQAAIAARGADFFNDNIRAHPQLRASSNVQEEISGLYTQLTLTGERWDANVGVRYVNTDVTSSGHTQDILTLQPHPDNPVNYLATFSDAVPLTVDNDYDNVLPSLNFTYRFSDNLMLRAAASQAITRPTFSQLGLDVNWEVNSPPARLTRNGNPYLKTVEADALDLSIEWYGSGGSSASAAVFYKDITNYVTNGVFTEVHLGTDFQVSKPINGDTAELMGIELAVQQLWDNGWGVMANYTYVDNEAEATIVNNFVARKVKTELDGVSENTFNVSGFYELGPVSARLAYVYRDEYVDCGFCGPRQTPRTTAASAFVDFSGSYALTDTLTLYLDAFNLTEEETHNYYIDRRFTHYYEKFSRRYEFGVRAKF